MRMSHPGRAVLLDLPNTPFPGTLTPDQQALAAGLRTAWASFAAGDDPSTRSLAWPLFTQVSR